MVIYLIRPNEVKVYSCGKLILVRWEWPHLWLHRRTSMDWFPVGLPAWKIEVESKKLHECYFISRAPLMLVLWTRYSNPLMNGSTFRSVWTCGPNASWFWTMQLQSRLPFVCNTVYCSHHEPAVQSHRKRICCSVALDYWCMRILFTSFAQTTTSSTCCRLWEWLSFMSSLQFLKWWKG